MNKTIAVMPFIEGQLTDSLSDDTVDVINPANGKWLLAIPAGNNADVDRAVASARVAFDDGRWCHSAPSLRKKILHRFADLVEQEASTLDALDAEEMGKPISIGFSNAAASAGTVRFYAEALDKFSGDVFNSDHNSFVTQKRVPVGVVAAITPWNFPTACAIGKIAPVLAAGNTLVLKPSELSSRSAIRLAQLALEAGIPPGVFNVVPGMGDPVGKALALHQQVNLITFTGSTAVGQSIMQYAAQSNLKRVMVECGGKSPHIVFDDGVDLDTAADGIAHFLLTNQGQICIAGTRLLVQASVEEALLDKVVSRFNQAVIGDPLNPNTTFGPIVTQRQCDKVMNYIEIGHESGAELVTGGNRILSESGGYFIEPTLFKGVHADAPIAQEEIFGPVLSTITFTDEAEAIRIANSSAYALSAYVWTTNLTTGMRMAEGLHSNAAILSGKPTEGAGHAASSEPAGLSGFGTEGGVDGIKSYLRRKTNYFFYG
mgnify:CR=1 FL=1